MTAALHILPRVWATASGEHASGSRTRLSLAHVADTIHHRPAAQPFAPGRRKGPHSLRLVQARAAEPAAQLALVPKPQPQPAPRALPVRPQPQLAFYRKYTEAMLRRYLKLSMEAGRVPSLIGQDMFRGNVSHCSVSGFDDVVIFVADINKCLAKLTPGRRYLVRKIAIEGYMMGEAAAMKGLSLRTVLQRYTEAIDQLTQLFLDRKLLNSMEDVEIEREDSEEDVAFLEG